MRINKKSVTYNCIFLNPSDKYPKIRQKKGKGSKKIKPNITLNIRVPLVKTKIRSLNKKIKKILNIFI